MSDQLLPRDAFDQTRDAVLATWETGRGITIENGAAFHFSLPPEVSFADAMRRARDTQRPLIQPRAGVALVDEHIALLRYLQHEGQADLLPTTIDAYTRQNRYEDAANGIRKSLTAGTSLLNGFPAVNHGQGECRRVVESVGRPIQVRHGTPDARLLAEITLGAGFGGFEGGGISYNIPYAKKVPLEKSIADWQYVDRLVGIYREHGININREPFGPLTGTLVPPFISHAVGIIEGLLALRQGVRSITLGYGQAGNVRQDTAALLSLRELADEYFQAAGYDDYDLTTVFHQWMGGFPEDEAKAFAVISWGAAVAAYARADKVIVKTPHEAMGIPTKQANAEGLRATRQVLNMLHDQRFDWAELVGDEVAVLKAEVRCVLEKVYELGRGDVADGAVAAFASGVLDIPFAPSMYNYGKMMPVRDNEGFVRILNKGNLPLTDDLLAYHRERLEERGRAEGRAVGFRMVTDDIYAISKGHLVGRPR
ncbi:MAG: methylaspartate mutase subunit E [Chitinivibrionales bacterium]|nr:methylaspartate mutase subunit E [Chitinivibrionales bacterium]